MVCSECYIKNSRGPCNKDSIPCLLIGIYPTFIRMTQCFNKLYYSGLIWPHFFSLLKYSIGFGNNLSGFFIIETIIILDYILEYFLHLFQLAIICFGIFI